MEKEKKFNKREYMDEYYKKTYKSVAFRVRKDETEVLQHLEKQTSKSAYILNLIKKDMKK